MTHPGAALEVQEHSVRRVIVCYKDASFNKTLYANYTEFVSNVAALTGTTFHKTNFYRVSNVALRLMDRKVLLH